jgi:hypothetical protein
MDLILVSEPAHQSREEQKKLLVGQLHFTCVQEAMFKNIPKATKPMVRQIETRKFELHVFLNQGRASKVVKCFLVTLVTFLWMTSSVLHPPKAGEIFPQVAVRTYLRVPTIRIIYY